MQLNLLNRIGQNDSSVFAVYTSTTRATRATDCNLHYILAQPERLTATCTTSTTNTTGCMEKQDMDTDTDTDTGHGHGHGRRSTVEKRSTIDFIDDHYQQFVKWIYSLHQDKSRYSTLYFTGEELKNDSTLHSTWITCRCSRC